MISPKYANEFTTRLRFASIISSQSPILRVEQPEIVPTSHNSRLSIPPSIYSRSLLNNRVSDNDGAPDARRYGHERFIIFGVNSRRHLHPVLSLLRARAHTLRSLARRSWHRQIDKSGSGRVCRVDKFANTVGESRHRRQLATDIIQRW